MQRRLNAAKARWDIEYWNGYFWEYVETISGLENAEMEVKKLEKIDYHFDVLSRFRIITSKN